MTISFYFLYDTNSILEASYTWKFMDAKNDKYLRPNFELVDNY